MSYIETLRRCEYFRELTDYDLKLIEKACHREEYDEGGILYHEGDEAKNLRIVEKGKVSIRIEEGLTKPLTVCIVSDGGAFGWSALVKPHLFTAGAKCLEKTSIIVISGAEMLRMCRADTRLGEIVMENLAYLISTRLRHARQQIPTQTQPW